MNVLLIHAHHEAQSFSSALKNTAVEFFTDRGDNVVVSDLVAMGFNPVASADDFQSRHRDDYLVYALEQRNAVKTDSLAPDIAAELEKLQQAELVIFNFPLYWYSVPAILKGWIDRVLVSGICYGGKRFYDRGGLAGKKALVCLTLGGREHMFGPNSIHGELEAMLRPLLQGTLAYTGMAVLPPFVAWHVPYVSDETRAGYLQQYRETLERLDEIEPLKMPSLDDFDEQLYPIK